MTCRYLASRVVPTQWAVIVCSFVISLLLAGGTRASAQNVTDGRIEKADNEPQNWLTFFGNYKAWSYSALNQITRDNVQRLLPVWTFPTGGHNGLESAPIVADGVL